MLEIPHRVAVMMSLLQACMIRLHDNMHRRGSEQLLPLLPSSSLG